MNFKPSRNEACPQPDLLSALKKTSPQCVVFQVMPNPPTIPKESSLDFNIPIPIAEIAKSCQTSQELVNKIHPLNPETVHEIERATVGQKDNKEWKHQRMGRLTASSMHLYPTASERFSNVRKVDV